MQKWEYLHINKSRGFDDRKKGESFQRATDWVNKIFTTDGERKIAHNDMIDLTAKLGDEGWELVAIAPRSNILGGHDSAAYAGVYSDFAGYTTQEVWVFKRPKE